MTVKADSKARLTGAQPETKYLRREAPDGTITYVPEGLKPSKTETTLIVGGTRTPGRMQVTVETDLKDLGAAVESIHRLAETTEAKEVWVKTSGIFGGVYDLLNTQEHSYQLFGYNPSAKDFEGLA